MFARGGYEVGSRHYPVIVLLHVAFLLSVYVEAIWVATPPSWWIIPFMIFIVAQGLRIWILSSLKEYWNTKIIISPASKPVVKGPYQYLRHPNYVIVMVEMVTIPLIFGAYYSAIVFPLLNALVLSFRIRVEEQALNQLDYQEVMEETPRFIPFMKKHK